MTDFGVGCDCKITRIFLKNKLNTTLHLLFYKKLFLSLFEDLTEIAYIHNTINLISIYSYIPCNIFPPHLSLLLDTALLRYDMKRLK